MSTEHWPVVVVGAGPVGLTAAHLLGRRGVRTLVLDRRSDPYPLPRAVHLDGEVVRILQEIGLAQEFATISRPMPGLHLVTGDLRLLAEFRRDTGGAGHPESVLFDQAGLDDLLERTLPAPVQVRRETTVTGVEVRGPRHADVHCADGTVLQAQAVLGCDGANSTTRASLGTRMRTLGRGDRWLVLDADTPRPLPVTDCVQQVCDPDRPATFMHVTGSHHRWEFRLAAGEPADRLLAPDRLAGLVSRWLTPAGLASADLRLRRSAEYTFAARVARQWRSGPVFLLGDAAHQTPPFIGQGLGAGLRDAHNLVWKLHHVLTGAAPERLLDTYQAERAPHVTATIRAAVLLGWVITGRSPLAGAVRAALRVVARVPRLASGAVNPSLRRGVLVLRGGGRLCPRGLLPDGFDGQFVVVTRGGFSGRVGLPCVSVDGALWTGGLRGACGVVVRPDRVVLGVARSGVELDGLVRRAREFSRGC